MLSRLVLLIAFTVANSAALKISSKQISTRVPTAAPINWAPAAAAFACAFSAKAALAADLAVDTSSPVAIGAAVVVLGGGAFAFNANSAANAEKEAAQLAAIQRAAEIKRAEAQRDKLSAQVSLGVPAVVTVAFVIFAFTNLL